MKKPEKKTVDQKIRRTEKRSSGSGRAGEISPKTRGSQKGDRKRMEKKIGRQSDQIQKNTEKLKRVTGRKNEAEEQIHIQTKAMESAVDGIFIIDAGKTGYPVIYVNPSFRKLTGYTKNEIIGQSYFQLYGADADRRVVDEVRAAMSREEIFHGEMLSFTKQGEKYWSSLRIAPVRDSKGGVTHYVGIQTDLTLIKQKNLEIEEQHEELLHVTRVGKLAEFVSSLAHEISQPLTAILSYAQAAQRILGDREPEVRGILQDIINDDERAAEVIRRLRVQLKKSKPVIEPLEINGLINDTVKLIKTHIEVRNNLMKFDFENNLPFILGDRIQIQQVLLNLISNSLEAMEANKGPRELLITTSRKDAHTILVEVKDSGSGILKEHMGKVFTHFFTSKPNGLGMGLPISRSIIESHGGKLSEKNNSGDGATFYFTLPVIEEGSDE